MPVNEVDVTTNITKPTTEDKAKYVASTTVLNTLFFVGINTGIAKWTKLGEDEFVRIGSKIETVKESVKGTKGIEDGLRTIFKSGKKEDLVKLVKSARIKSAVKEGVIFGIISGLLTSLFQIHVDEKAAKQKV